MMRHMYSQITTLLSPNRYNKPKARSRQKQPSPAIDPKASSGNSPRLTFAFPHTSREPRTYRIWNGGITIVITKLEYLISTSGWLPYC